MDRRPAAAQWTDALPYGDLIAQSRILPRAFYERPAAEVARELLGAVLVHGRTAGRIVETEAYLGLEDLAAHASKGLTERTRVLFGPPGHAYVYFIYGAHECLNVVAEPDGIPGCVLIRALEPLCGLAEMRARRPAARSPQDLASGPGKLTQALAITRRHYGADLTRGPVLIRKLQKCGNVDVLVTPRIGVTQCADWPLRFVIAGSPFASRRK